MHHIHSLDSPYSESRLHRPLWFTVCQSGSAFQPRCRDFSQFHFHFQPKKNNFSSSELHLQTWPAGIILGGIRQFNQSINQSTNQLINLISQWSFATIEAIWQQICTRIVFGHGLCPTSLKGAVSSREENKAQNKVPAYHFKLPPSHLARYLFSQPSVCLLLRPRLSGRKIAISQSVCLSVSLSERISENHMCRFHQIFCMFTCCRGSVLL